ncbi:KamA family radical SAM protein [Alloalcanivorax venustensis]|jgi:KamA family protein|uniref:KamA family radical SAM protein n=1 Tax=Alloalcanivorax TaxID=3020832 RepID=UPI000798BF19|nr:MAG: lysine 2,3-aminomutase [Alcanivorax sp. Nap_24]MAQ35148.1 lysine 2,3-aminomutase [Alcanivorax sp.]MEA3260590.1 lysine 2,3-aminomutase [Pseudomonadota bacterium]MBA4730732.1 lysine 2,3-aminomutase [Alcanivorax sp.]MBL4723270.1 lysine 2,3-aminomutase [Alcanivorax sp.]|tara:strand:- start:49489 stop:50844 length:1356 start_codon:yes stop_codon:yes gene_type:complete
MSEANTVIPLREHQEPATQEPRRFKVFTARQLDKIEQLQRLDDDARFAMRVVANVLPFRVNEYVIEELIDWDKVPDDPIYQLTFPQKGMLAPEHFDKVADAMRGGDKAEIDAAVAEVREALNPHPAGQMEHNIPEVDGEKIDGIQHKYNETVLFFPSQGQVCHSYCTFCFRWAQFIGDNDLKIATKEAGQLKRYVQAHPEITDILITGGDPLVMKTKNLRAHIEPLLELEQIRTIRIGSKALTFWPQRVISDKDADDLLDLFREVQAAGKHLALMAHYNHWRELEPAIAREAIARVRETGAQIRAQGPLLAHINDNADDWARLWQTQVELGIVPYYMFVERDTGARRYFEVPLARAWNIYRDAMKQVSGLARTARGPSMSSHPGKVEIQGVTEVAGEKVFVLRLIQGRNPDWVQRPFFAKYNEDATWLNHLEPAFGEDKFFFDDELAAMED